MLKIATNPTYFERALTTLKEQGDSPLFSFNLKQLEPVFKMWIQQVTSQLDQPEPEPSQLKYLTRSEVSRALSISLPTVDRYVSLGILKSKKVGTRILFEEAEIKASLQNIPVKFSRR